MNVSKHFSLVSMIFTVVFGLTNCAAETKTSGKATKNADGESDPGGTKKNPVPSLGLDLPDDMKDNDQAPGIEEWEYSSKFEHGLGDDVFELRCNNEPVKSLKDLDGGKVRGVFALSLFQTDYAYGPAYDVPSSPTPSEPPPAEGPSKDEPKKEQVESYDDKDGAAVAVSEEEEKYDGKERYDGEDYADEDFESSTSTSDYWQGESLIFAHVVLPYACEGKMTVSMNLEAEHTYFVEANLYSPSMDLLQSGATEKFNIEDGVVPLQMHAERQKAQGKVDLQVIFDESK